MSDQDDISFHLGFPVDDLRETRAFYGELLNCEVLSLSERTISINFWGHQLVGHLVPEMAGEHGTNEIDGSDVPIPHFGAVLDWDEWQELADRFRASEHDFVIDPYVRDRGTPDEEAKMFVRDPSGNTLEFKAFKHDDKPFA